jgi:hypothetical protein
MFDRAAHSPFEAQARHTAGCPSQIGSPARLQSVREDVQPTQIPFGLSALHMGVLGSRVAQAVEGTPGALHAVQTLLVVQMGVCHGQCGDVTHATQRPDVASQRLPGFRSQSLSLRQRMHAVPVQTGLAAGHSRSSAQKRRSKVASRGGARASSGRLWGTSLATGTSAARVASPLASTCAGASPSASVIPLAAVSVAATRGAASRDGTAAASSLGGTHRLLSSHTRPARQSPGRAR